MWDTQSLRASSALGLNAVVAALYAIAGGIILAIGQYSGLAAPVWPAAGIAFAFAYRWGWRLLPGIFIGSIIVNSISLASVANPTTAVLSSAGVVALGAALQAFIGALLVRRTLGTHLGLDGPREILVFLALAGLVATLINPTISVAVELANGILSWDQAGIGWLTWWVGDSIGVIVFAPITLMVFGRHRSIWVRRQWPVVIPSVLVVLGVFVAIGQTTSVGQQRIQLQVDALGTQAARELVASADHHGEVLKSVESLFISSDEVTSEEFRTFTKGALERFPNMQAVSWNPYLTQSEVPAFLEHQRSQPGLQDYAITQRNAAGDLEPASPRADYVAVGYIEPLASNMAALGYDIQSNPQRVEAINTARDTGEPAGTAPIELVQESGSQKGMLVLDPLYRDGMEPTTVDERRANLEGFAVGVYRLGDLLNDTYSDSTWNPVDIRLFDVTNTAEPVEIAHLPSRDPATVDLLSGSPSTTTSPIDMYGRSWELQVTPTSGPLADPSPEVAPLLLVSSLAAVFLLEAFLLLITGLEHRARRQAELSSFEASHDSLTGLLNRRAFMRELASASERKSEQGDVLMYCDLDEFKAVNDEGGHEAGDLMLQGISSVLKTQIRTHDVVARIGGDEFAIILYDCTVDQGFVIAREIRNAVEAFSVPVNHHSMSVGISIGATVIEHGDNASVDELMRRADTACYDVKHDGKGHVRMYDRDA